eukprot:Awhi_evm1s1325
MDVILQEKQDQWNFDFHKGTPLKPNQDSVYIWCDEPEEDLYSTPVPIHADKKNNISINNDNDELPSLIPRKKDKNDVAVFPVSPTDQKENILTKTSVEEGVFQQHSALQNIFRKKPINFEAKLKSYTPNTAPATTTTPTSLILPLLGTRKSSISSSLASSNMECSPVIAASIQSPSSLSSLMKSSLDSSIRKSIGKKKSKQKKLLFSKGSSNTHISNNSSNSHSNTSNNTTSNSKLQQFFDSQSHPSQKKIVSSSSSPFSSSSPQMMIQTPKKTVFGSTITTTPVKSTSKISSIAKTPSSSGSTLVCSSSKTPFKTQFTPIKTTSSRKLLTPNSNSQIS